MQTRLLPESSLGNCIRIRRWAKKSSCCPSLVLVLSNLYNYPCKILLCKMIIKIVILLIETQLVSFIRTGVPGSWGQSDTFNITVVITSSNGKKTPNKNKNKKEYEEKTTTHSYACIWMAWLRCPHFYMMLHLLHLQ